MLLLNLHFEAKHLSREDLFKLEKSTFKEKGLNKVLDCFLFQCYTGMAFIELTNFDALNGWFGEIRGIAENSPLRVRTFSAQAKAASAKRG